MRLLSLLLCIAVTLGVVHGRMLTCSQETGNKNNKPQLRLSTNIDEQHYSRDTGPKMLHMGVSLTYSNTGSRPILLYKKSSLVYQTLVSTSTKAAGARRYVYDESSHFIGLTSMSSAGSQMHGTPDRSAFITLNPGEEYSLKQEILLKLYDGTKHTEGLLRPGSYYLQVRVATWYYLAEPTQYRESWNGDGYLWSENMTSIPMSFKIEAIASASTSHDLSICVDSGTVATCRPLRVICRSAEAVGHS